MRNGGLVLSIAVVASVTSGCGRERIGDEPSVDVPAVAASAASSSPAAAAAGDVTSATSSADPALAFSTADVEFLAVMLSHHTAAQQIVELAEQRAAPEVRAFASAVRTAQQPEIEHMTRWLAALGVDPATAGGHDHGGVTRDDIDELGKLAGPAFDEAFLDVVADHSVSASVLARSEASDGFNSAVRELAGRIVEREWADMQTIRRLR